MPKVGDQWLTVSVQWFANDKCPMVNIHPTYSLFCHVSNHQNRKFIIEKLRGIVTPSRVRAFEKILRVNACTLEVGWPRRPMHAAHTD